MQTTDQQQSLFSFSLTSCRVGCVSGEADNVLRFSFYAFTLGFLRFEGEKITSMVCTEKTHHIKHREVFERWHHGLFQKTHWTWRPWGWFSAFYFSNISNYTFVLFHPIIDVNIKQPFFPLLIQLSSHFTSVRSTEAAQWEKHGVDGDEKHGYKKYRTKEWKKKSNLLLILFYLDHIQWHASVLVIWSVSTSCACQWSNDSGMKPTKKGSQTVFVF